MLPCAVPWHLLSWAPSSKPAARYCSGRQIRQTDGRTPDRYVDPASLSVRAASESKTANVGVITIAACTARNPHSRVVSFAVKWLMVNGDDLIVMTDWCWVIGVCAKYFDCTCLYTGCHEITVTTRLCTETHYVWIVLFYLICGTIQQVLCLW